LSFKSVRIYILLLMLCLFAGFSSFAQKGKGKPQQTRAQQVLDSTRAAQKAIVDAQKAERQRTLDSAKDARAKAAELLAEMRKQRSDSLARIAKYKTSKKYTDSVAKARTRAMDSVKQERQLVLDAQKAERQAVLDSVMAIRKATTDQLKEAQAQRSDSLATIRKYKESKRYADSVAVVRQKRLDSIQLVRKVFNDSSMASRKRIADSSIASRKAILDSTMAVRKKFTDSLTAVRKVRTDSLAVVKEKREKLRKQEEKKKEQKMNLAIDLKIKAKQKAYTNESMLKKKWSAPRQVIQNTFTRYNYYFNAYNKMQEAKANMNRIGRENYDSLIALYPFNPDKDSTSIAPDMDSIIHKVSLGIQIHDPRTKWGDDLYLLLGEAYYYKGDYKNAGAAFRFIIGMNERNKKKAGGSSSGSYGKKKGDLSIVEEDKQSALDFLKHQSVNNEAIMWLSRTFTQSRMPENAEVVLDLVASDPKLPESLKGNLAMTKAFLLLNNNDFRGAAEQLKIAANDPYLPDDQRQRAAYLSGQIYQQEGNYAAANESFQKTIDLHPAIEMDFYARKNLAYNAMYSGENQEVAIASLKKILRDYKYSGYYEQVYFIMGRLAANDERAFEAINYLNKGLGSAKTTKKQKALSYATLGNVYYRIGDYVAAKSSYDSSAMLAKYAPNDSTVDIAIHRSNVLGSVTEPYLAIRTQDSLLTLASLSEKDQRSEVRKYIKALEKQRLDSIYNAENAGINNVAQNDDVNAGNSGWYFANATQMRKGQSEFKRVWGNRPAVDNWRRMSAIGFGNNAGGSNNTVVETNEDGNLELDENGLPTEQSLMAMIPTSPEKQEKANKIIQKAYVDLGDAYIMQLEDYPLAVNALDTLNIRYKAHDQKERELYLRYVMALRQSRIPDAQKYSAQLLKQFPNSQYATLVKPTEDGANMAGSTGGETVANYYDLTYSLLLQRQYTEVLQRIKTARQKYTNSPYAKRFTVMEGIALAGAGNYVQADTLLREFIKGNATDTLRPWAEAVLEYVNKNKPATPKVDSSKITPPQLPGGTPGNTTTSSTNVNTKVEIAQPTGEVPNLYSYKPEAEHYCVMSFPSMDGRATSAKKAITDFNAFRYPALRLQDNIDMLSQNEGLVTVQKFASVSQAREYMNALKAATQVFREYQSSEYQLFLVSAVNYQKLLSDHNVKPYLDFYKVNYK
jgi:tetratricopeptide (TPR) repeat protein